MLTNKTQPGTRRSPWLFAGLLFCGLLVACRAQVAEDKLPPNVILIVIDTLRTDHLTLSGYPAATSPGLKRLAGQGVFFERFYAHSAITRPSVATLLTSRFISGHGIYAQMGQGLSPNLPYLPEILRAAGFSTNAFVTNPQIHRELGFARGFDHFEALYSGRAEPENIQPKDLVKVPAAEVFKSVTRHLEANVHRPFFYYVHLIDPHGPYDSADRAAAFIDGEYHGNITGSIADFTKIQQLRDHPRDLEYFKALYSAEIAATDEAIANFVDGLRNSHLLDSTHLLITADHGEELLDHGGLGHGIYLHEELLRIPLLWLGPGVPKGRRVDALAGLIDILPTLLDVLKIQAPEGASFQGRSLRGLWKGSTPVRWRKALFIEGIERWASPQGPPAVARAVVTRNYKVLARDCVINRPEWSTLQVFNLKEDPQEKHGREINGDLANLSRDDRAVAKLYMQQVDRALSHTGLEQAPTAELPQEDLERLKSLGYVQ